MVPSMSWFTSFLIILTLLSLRFFGGHARQVKKSVVLASKGSETVTSSMHIAIYDGVPVAAESDQRTMLGPGRKMMTGGLSKEIKSDEHWNSEAYYGARGQRMSLNAKPKLSRRGGDSVQVKMTGFVSLNADYHVPRPHPPKNN